MQTRHPDTGALLYHMSPGFKFLRRLHKLKFQVIPALREKNKRDYTIARFEFGEKWGHEGATPNTVRFNHRGRDLSIADHWKEKYGTRLRFPDLPMVVTGKGEYFPVELIELKEWQRYQFKLDPEQVRRARLVGGSLSFGMLTQAPDEQDDQVCGHTSAAAKTRYHGQLESS